MDLSRLRLGEALAAAAGVLLLVVLFLPWYGALQEDDSAWEALRVLSVVLALTAVLAIGLALVTVTGRSVAIPVAASVLTAGAGIVATVLVLYRLLDEPGPNELVSVKYGAYLGLGAAFAVAFGGWQAMRETGEGVGVSQHQPPERTAQTESPTQAGSTPPPGP